MRRSRLSAESKEARRASVVDEAIRANKIPPERREHYEREWDLNPVATEALLRELAPGVPLSPDLLSAGEGLPAEWFSVEPRKRSALSAEQGAATTKGDGGGLPWVKPRAQSARRGRITFAGDE